MTDNATPLNYDNIISAVVRVSEYIDENLQQAVRDSIQLAHDKRNNATMLD